MLALLPSIVRSFFFNDTATTEIYTLSLHDALPISCTDGPVVAFSAAMSSVPFDRSPVADPGELGIDPAALDALLQRDRKSTRLNSSHQIISYAVFCLKTNNKNVNDIAPGRPRAR